MRKKLTQARASALNGVAARKGGNVFVLASSIHEGQPVYNSKAAMASHKCESCTTEFSTLAGVSPFCPNCGSGETKASEAPAQTLPITDEELSALDCPSCSTANILHDATAKVLDGHIHCVTCGTEVSFETVADGEGSKPVVMETRDPDGKIAIGDDGKHGDAPAADVLKQADTKVPQVNPPVMSAKETADEKGVHLPTETGEQDRPIKDADAADIKNAVVNKDLKGIPSVQEAAEEPMDDPVVEALEDDDFSEDDEMPAEASTEIVAEKDDRDTDGDGDVDKEDDFGGKKAPPFGKKDESAVETVIDVPVLSTILAFKGPKSLQCASVGNKVLAFVNDQHVATLTEEKAGGNANVMHTASFQKAVGLAAQSEGLHAAFAKYSFELATVKFPQKAVMAKLVAKATKQEANRLRKETAAHEQTFMQCMSIAAAGLNKGFFAKEENALKRGFYESLTAAGFKGAEKLIDSVFAKYGDVHHKTLLSLAQTLMDKPVEVRNSMSETVLESSYLQVKAAEEGDEGSDDSSSDEAEESSTALTARLESSAIVASRGRATSTASTIRELAESGSFFKRV